jgi:pimeloyl-ACP methyl ester carboxylesterase
MSPRTDIAGVPYTSNMRLGRSVATGAIAVAFVGGGILNAQLPAIGAGGLLHPARTITQAPTPIGCGDVTFNADGVSLRGWRCHTTARTARGTIVYLHGIGDNRGSAAGVIQRFVPLGFDVIAYDSRAHGQSSGDACTYGYYEKGDLRRVIDTARVSPIILIGTSLGAAVALQEATDDPRVTAVIAAETFADLRSVATERAPAFFSQSVIDKAFALAEREAGMRVDDVSPEQAADRVAARVMLIHGAADTDTPPAHSQRVYARLRSDKRLLLVPGAHHNQSLNSDTWAEIERWLR